MGYCNANGHVSLKEKVPMSVIDTLINAEFLVEDASDGGLWLTMDEISYEDERIENALKALKEYVEVGDVEFFGIDDCEHWRYEFDNGNLYYAEGEIVFKRKMEVV